MATYEVCDISTYQTVSNYTSFASAIDGVILRAGYRGYGSAGNMVKDTKLETHYAGLAGKTKIGYYFFTQAITETEAAAEADYVVNTLIGNKQNDFPIYWDTEGSGAPNGSGRADGLSKAQRTKCCIAFINRIKALGKRAGVYASESWFKTNLDFSQILATGASIWVAKYSSYTPSTSSYDGWQYTSSASVSGISTRVDKSHFYVDVAGWDGTPSGSGDNDDADDTTIVTGQKIILNNTPLYGSSTATSSAGNRTGTYYIWSSDTINGRVRITNSPSNVGVSGQVTGWVNVSDINTDGSDPSPSTVPVTGVQMNSRSESVVLVTGSKTIQLSATVNPSNATNKNVSWSSSDTSIATVSDSGLVTCLKAGTATITVTTQESLYTDTCTVTISQAVTGVTLNKTSLGLGVGETSQLSATVNPSNATNKNVSWSSSNTSIATVSDSGLITAKENGSCIITVTTQDQGKTANCNVVVSTHITNVTLDKTSANIEVGNTLQLNATIVPNNTTDDKTLTWSSSDTSIATVNNSGLVNVLQSGSATITVKTSNNITATCNIKGVVYPTGITLNKNKAEYILDETESEITLSVIFEPSNTTEKTITWESTNTSIATVNNSGKITCIAPGSCYITATDVKNHKQECLLEVYKRYDKPDVPTIIDENIGKFEIVLTPVEGCEYSIDKGINWQKSSRFINLNYNTSYVFCQRRFANEYYLESEMSDTIIIQTKDIVHIESMTLDCHEKEIILVGDNRKSFKLVANILPTNADIKDIIWSVDNLSVGDVDNNGIVTLFEYGILEVTAQTLEGGFIDKCIVNVYKKWETPDNPIPVEVTKDSIILVGADHYVYAKDSLDTFVSNNIFTGLKENTNYRFWQKKLAYGNRLESDVSKSVSIRTLSNNTPIPAITISIKKLKLSSNYFYFDIEKNTKATLRYTVEPEDTTNNTVYWYSTDENVCTIDADGIVNAVGIGTCRIYIRSVENNNIQDSCICEVYKYKNKPDIPQIKDTQLHSIELVEVEGCEYSIDDGETWQDSTLFPNLLKNSYYSFCQRYKEISSYQPASDKSNSRIQKTLSDTQEGGESESGYKIGELVEVKDIPVYPSPYARKSEFTVTGDYYIHNINERNNRIRITDDKDDVGFVGNSIGWVKISDLQRIIDNIYIGDKIIVNGNINTNVDGSGLFINKQKETMFVTNIFKEFEYPYEVSSKAGANKIGYAKETDIRKYEY